MTRRIQHVLWAPSRPGLSSDRHDPLTLLFLPPSSHGAPSQIRQRKWALAKTPNPWHHLPIPDYPRPTHRIRGRAAAFNNKKAPQPSLHLSMMPSRPHTVLPDRSLHLPTTSSPTQPRSTTGRDSMATSHLIPSSRPDSLLPAFCLTSLFHRPRCSRVPKSPGTHNSSLDPCTV